MHTTFQYLTVKPIFHKKKGSRGGVALGVSVRVGGNANFSIFRYQHVGTPNAKLWCWESKPMGGPNMNGFAPFPSLFVVLYPSCLYGCIKAVCRCGK